MGRRRPLTLAVMRSFSCWKCHYFERAGAGEAAHRGEAESRDGESGGGRRAFGAGGGRGVDAAGLQRVLKTGGAQIAVCLAVSCSNTVEKPLACERRGLTGAHLGFLISTTQ